MVNKDFGGSLKRQQEFQSTEVFLNGEILLVTLGSERLSPRKLST